MKLAALFAVATVVYALSTLARRLCAQCERLVEQARREEVGEGEERPPGAAGTRRPY